MSSRRRDRLSVPARAPRPAHNYTYRGRDTILPHCHPYTGLYRGALIHWWAGETPCRRCASAAWWQHHRDHIVATRYGEHVLPSLIAERCPPVDTDALPGFAIYHGILENA